MARKQKVTAADALAEANAHRPDATTTTNHDGPACQCGCKGTTKGGRFLPGHDARLKGRLFAAAHGPDDNDRAEALVEIEAQGWMHLFDKSVARPEREAKVRAERKPRREVVDEEQARAAAHLEMLNGMKRAARLVRQHPEDPRIGHVDRTNYLDILHDYDSQEG